MLPKFIGPEFEKTGKLAKNKNVNEEKETEESKVDHFQEDRESITSIKKKYDIDDSYIVSIKKKNGTVNKVGKSRDKSVSNRPNKISQ